MPAQLSPNLRATLDAYVPHGIDGIEAQTIVRAAKAEPDVAAALETIRAEYGAQFTVGGRLTFEQAAASALDLACDVPPRRPVPGGRFRAQAEQLLRDVESGLAQLDLQYERKQNVGILAALSSFASVSAATLVMMLQDRTRIRSLEAEVSRTRSAQDAESDAEEQVQRLTLIALRAEQLVELAADATHTLVEMLAASDGEARAARWLLAVSRTTPSSTLERMRAELPGAMAALLKKSFAHGGADAERFRAQLTAALDRL